MSEHQPVNDLPHLRIKTEAGKEFWSYMNNNYGSSVWGRVEDGILAVEAEMRKQLAEAWEEGARWAAVECRAVETEDEPWLTPSDNPYREETE